MDSQIELPPEALQALKRVPKRHRADAEGEAHLAVRQGEDPAVIIRNYWRAQSEHETSQWTEQKQIREGIKSMDHTERQLPLSSKRYKGSGRSKARKDLTYPDGGEDPEVDPPLSSRMDISTLIVETEKIAERHAP